MPVLKSWLAIIPISLIYCLSWVPFDILRRIGRFIGPAILKRDKRTVASVNRNIELCLPELSEQQRASLVVDRYRQLCQTIFEMSHVWLKSESTLSDYFIDEFDNASFEALMQGDESVIVLVPHIGNWEMASVYLNKHRRFTAMFQTIKNPRLNSFILKVRQRFGATLVEASSRGVAKLKVALKKPKGLVVILPDQVPGIGAGGVFAPFFHTPALTMTLAHKLALKTGVKVFTCAVFQREQGFAVCARPINESFYSINPEISASALNNDIEELVRMDPVQYQWEYKRFREQPPGVLSPYITGKYAFRSRRDPEG
ncbi:lysophospholipid acyltransferase family protein [Glaciecola sp. MH2013]|uniref:lysophospholipid acyltransferase family protein n=1 Tax=Glaciecola sp. MH2013 TaxID=2785524 RepID=UPI0018A0BA7B|nr:lysophospholipid acyltransferase family protein [Glaciecola sp. MH2013]MBF7073320.1 lysophospholipid acyltransferase family protein [Glaciecola sp. MH2013]